MFSLTLPEARYLGPVFTRVGLLCSVLQFQMVFPISGMKKEVVC